jgi:Lon protease-like protein
MARLPLFPLGTVLVPGAQLPLQVFEPRYIAMLQDLVASDDQPDFGVVAIRHGHEVGADAARDLHEIGCVARVSGAAAVGDGRFLVLGEGGRRFHLDRVATEAGTAYLTGEVSWLGEETGDPAEAAELARSVRDALGTYARALGAEEPDCPGDPTELSYAVGAAASLGLTERQQLLAAPDTCARLRLGLRMLRRETALTRGLRLAPPQATGGFNPN